MASPARVHPFHPGQRRPVAKAAIPDGDEQKVRALTREKTEPRYSLWQRESVREMREIIARHVGQG